MRPPSPAAPCAERAVPRPPLAAPAPAQPSRQAGMAAWLHAASCRPCKAHACATRSFRYRCFLQRQKGGLECRAAPHHRIAHGPAASAAPPPPTPGAHRGEGRCNLQRQNVEQIMSLQGWCRQWKHEWIGAELSLCLALATQWGARWRACSAVHGGHHNGASPRPAQGMREIYI